VRLRHRLRAPPRLLRRGGRIVLGTPKSQQSRTVPLPRFLAAEIAGAVAGKHADQLVFTMPSGSVMRLPNWRRSVFLSARRRAGLSGRFRVHDLRHTAASQFPGGLPTEDAARDHGPCQHRHDPGPVRAPLPGGMDHYADRLNEAAGMSDPDDDAAKMRPDGDGDEQDKE
jgi:hypothetical protein